MTFIEYVRRNEEFLPSALACWLATINVAHRDKTPAPGTGPFDCINLELLFPVTGALGRDLRHDFDAVFI